MEKYLTIWFIPMMPLEEAMEILKDYHRKGERAKGMFSGVMLYSDKDTLETAMEKLGLTNTNNQ